MEVIVGTQAKRLPEIKLPYGIVASRYGPEAAAILRTLQDGKAEDAKSKPAKDFNWSIGYEIAADPDTKDAAEFAQYLANYSAAWLVCNGFKWKAQVKLSSIPEQIMARLEERARLICGVTHIPQREERHAEIDIEDELNRWVSSHPSVDSRIAAIARVVLAQLVASSNGD